MISRSAGSSASIASRTSRVRSARSAAPAGRGELADQKVGHRGRIGVGPASVVGRRPRGSRIASRSPGAGGRPAPASGQSGIGATRRPAWTLAPGSWGAVAPGQGTPPGARRPGRPGLVAPGRAGPAPSSPGERDAGRRARPANCCRRPRHGGSVRHRRCRTPCRSSVRPHPLWAADWPAHPTASGPPGIVPVTWRGRDILRAAPPRSRAVANLVRQPGHEGQTEGIRMAEKSKGASDVSLARASSWPLLL